jgi:endonuclease YncB( thermonuclease family)
MHAERPRGRSPAERSGQICGPGGLSIARGARTIATMWGTIRSAVVAGVVLLAAGPAHAWKGDVLRVHTADFISAQYGRGHANISLQGVRAPRPGQPFAKQAKRLTEKLVSRAKGTVRVVPNGKSDRDGRIIARVWASKVCLNDELVKAGLAWWDRSGPKDKKLARLEAAARKAKRGLWAKPGPVPPWEWDKDGKQRGK